LFGFGVFGVASEPGLVDDVAILTVSLNLFGDVTSYLIVLGDVSVDGFVEGDDSSLAHVVGCFEGVDELLLFTSVGDEFVDKIEFPFFGLSDLTNFRSKSANLCA